MVACGATDPLEPAAAGQYTAALAHIGRPALSLGHVTKAEDGRYPFGSVFWHNLARLTWSLTRGPVGTVLTCRKANNYPAIGRVLVDMQWWEDRPVRVTEVPAYSAKLAELVAEVLAGEEEGLTVAGILEQLDAQREEDEPPLPATASARRSVAGSPRHPASSPSRAPGHQPGGFSHDPGQRRDSGRDRGVL